MLAELLGGEAKNIFAVGDPDQAIFRFRGASSAAFEEFQRRFPQTQSVTLDENQRSRGNILRVAYSAIEPNPSVRPLGSKLQFERRPLESGRDRREMEAGHLVFDESVEVVLSPSDPDEASEIAAELVRLRAAKNGQGKDRQTMAVLYRSHVHREKVIEELASRGVPFIVRGMGVMETPVSRDLMAVVRAVMNDHDADSVFRVCALPEFGMSPDELRRKLAAAERGRTFKSILQEMETGKLVLAALRAALEFVTAQKLDASGALEYLAKQFGFPKGDPAVRALHRFASDWVQKPFVREKSLKGFLEYVGAFQESGGVIPLLSEDEVAQAEEDNPDAVRLMTVHAAKGLEFTHVWLLRVVSPGFPSGFRERLFELPGALRKSIVLADGKEVHDQEERRLFYVAITRARDRLAIHSRPGRGKDRTPPGFLRDLLGARGLAPSLQSREGRRPALSLPRARWEISPATAWMLLPPAFEKENLALSAHAVESYSTCPLRFKLERDWKIPGEAAAAMQYGSAIHTVLRQYYDPAPQAPAMSLDDALAAFKKEFDKAVVDDPVQRELYETQGYEQLRALLQATPKGSVDVIGAEVRFEFMLGQQKVVGRMDRIDRVGGNVVRVIDYKTGKPKDRRFADESLQLSIYAMGASHLGFTPKELVLLNVQGNEEVSVTRSPVVLQRAQQKLQDVAEGIAQGKFDATPGRHCQWCDYWKLCPATEQRMFIPAAALAESN
jgi:DNA helicase-2/ATP-dependent DNA helicase PcrA